MRGTRRDRLPHVSWFFLAVLPCSVRCISQEVLWAFMLTDSMLSFLEQEVCGHLWRTYFKSELPSGHSDKWEECCTLHWLQWPHYQLLQYQGTQTLFRFTYAAFLCKCFFTNINFKSLLNPCDLDMNTTSYLIRVEQGKKTPQTNIKPLTDLLP